MLSGLFNLHTKHITKAYCFLYVNWTHSSTHRPDETSSIQYMNFIGLFNNNNVIYDKDKKSMMIY